MNRPRRFFAFTYWPGFWLGLAMLALLSNFVTNSEADLVGSLLLLGVGVLLDVLEGRGQ